MEPLIVVTGAGLIAGAMNALAGGGSFVSLPALIAAGLPPVQANASSTVALFPGGVVSAWAYRDGLSPVGPVSIRAMLVMTVIGGLIGAGLLLSTSSSTFSFLLPWLMLCASLSLAFGRTLGEALRRRWRIGAPAVLAIQLALGVYGGYFGGAVGIMMMAVWGLLDKRDIKSLNAPRTLLVSAANSVAVVTFSLAHAVRWPETIAMLVAAVAGGYSGAQIGRRMPPAAIITGTLMLSAGITIAFFVRTYGPMFSHR
ncbi:sulfite exporter TauE/SafE family protein [Caballeronia sp. LZ062]|uniref:sulfite exporter TauE/SafE family protein n=1 Tax=unclassified Caballeronia TaxID=2646786 RepID=UPI00285F91B2|nr:MULTISPECIES: sulfite exporter TauE/SafE family protein [unclassified Caballeronia]MDR5856077.1 sulfite exporter TauE/SafE family protein [Caballeronia sp. LZ050]MDR5872748.1 sulfite exporter TauE/SafE family protein [Caballeronia sp. LZ062]